MGRGLRRWGPTVPYAPATGSTAYAPQWTVRNKTANYTAVDGDLVEADATAGAITITVPNTAKARTVVKKMDASSNAVIISPSAGTVDGGAAINLTAQYEARETVGDGTNVIAVSERKVFGSPVAVAAANSDGTSNKMPRADHVHDASAYVPKTLVDAKGDLIVATADDTPARLAVGTDGQIIQADSTQATGVKWAGRSRVAVSTSSDVTVVNTVVETNLASLAVPTTLSAGDMLRIVAYGDMLNNTGAAVAYILKFYLGATAALSSSSSSQSNQVQRRKWSFEADVLVVTPASAQRIGGMAILSLASVSSLPFGASASAAGYGTAAEDLTAGKNAVLSVTMDTASASADMVCHFAAVEVIKA